MSESKFGCFDTKVVAIVWITKKIKSWKFSTVMYCNRYIWQWTIKISSANNISICVRQIKITQKYAKNNKITTIYKKNGENIDGCVYTTIANDDIHSVMMVHFSFSWISSIFSTLLWFQVNKQTRKYTHTKRTMSIFLISCAKTIIQCVTMKTYLATKYKADQCVLGCLTLLGWINGNAFLRLQLQLGCLFNKYR